MSCNKSWFADAPGNRIAHTPSQKPRGLTFFGTRIHAPEKVCHNRWFVEDCHALTSFESGCPVLHRPDCFRPSDRLAGWDSHPLEIADFHGVLS